MTKDFKLLRKRIIEIISNFSNLIEKYPKEINNKNQDLIKSFILLCHAELESYFENICIKIISKNKASFDNNNIVTKPLLALSLMSGRTFKEEDKTLQTAKERLDKLYTNYFATIKNNNGIKEKNLKNILPHIGIEMNSIDSILLSQLTAFGEKRGHTAHNAQKVIRRFNDEITSINNIIVGLEDLDKKFKELL